MDPAQEAYRHANEAIRSAGFEFESRRDALGPWNVELAF